MNVVILPTRRPCFCDIFLNFSDKFGKISLVITADIVLASEEVIDIVAANNPDKTKPTNPAGSNSIANNPYELSGLSIPGIIRGAAHIGKNIIRGNIRYNTPDKYARFFAILPEGDEIYLAAKFQAPPL